MTLEEDSLIRNVKFAIYCIYAGDKFTFVSDSSTWINYSTCDIKVDTISRLSDTLELGIHLYYDNKLINFNEIVKNGVTHVAAVLFDTQKSKIIRYITDDNLGFVIGNPKSRYFNPLQLDVEKYIKNNKESLNPWFREEAKRRKIIN